ncbi:hypothetical protein LTR95_001223 [Oleoguttula sp. CCFEE 5521]|uniref:UNC93-like protein n=1 Tax=Cryoendolithus antarcticus TaxID=1507870 RepID=A0A1V8T9D8_9PEZI|nr:hypothetical protein B0A48_06639 [Cryoendolithus antarcticus]OQO10529.1 hypothetical protein B0A48_03826 [Cryoendolithus antarcticus]
MAEAGEKAVPVQETYANTNPEDGVLTADRPAGWMYRERKIGPIRIPWFAGPEIQLLMVAFVCFLCPGMFNAINGLGGGGQVDPKPGNDANVAVYAAFCVVGFFAGSITNWLGVKAALSFGGIGYCVYVSSYLCYNHTKNYGYMIFAGFWLGCSAGVLWAAQGAIMMAYPPEGSKGKYISTFWAIFNLGGVIGSLIPLGQNIHTTSNSTVSDGTYVGFIILTFLGATLAWFLVDAKKVIRKDGSRVIVMKHPTWKTELWGLWETLISDPFIVFLFPMFFASNWFYTYQFNGVNLAQFNTRTRSLNNVLYWTAQIFGAMVFGYALDLERFRRTTRAKACWVALFVLTFVIYGGGYAFQKGYTRAEVNAGADTPDDPSDDYVKMDWTSSGYVGPMFLYIFYGFYDAAWQCSVYWFMGAMTNNGRKLANYAAFYKSIQSAAAVIIWRIDSLGITYMSELGSTWGLLAGSLVIALPVMLKTIKDTVPLEEDLKLSDETAEEVVGHKVMVTETTQEKI